MAFLNCLPTDSTQSNEDKGSVVHNVINIKKTQIHLVKQKKQQ